MWVLPPLLAIESRIFRAAKLIGQIIVSLANGIRTRISAVTVRPLKPFEYS